MNELTSVACAYCDGARQGHYPRGGMEAGTNVKCPRCEGTGVDPLFVIKTRQGDFVLIPVRST